MTAAASPPHRWRDVAGAPPTPTPMARSSAAPTDGPRRMYVFGAPLPRYK
jgi:hypothetical protein